MPNLFIIGAPKCATTSLAAYLSNQQDIYVPAIKEMRYFDTDAHFQDRDRYLTKYSPDNGAIKYFCDASPTYLCNHDVVIPRILSSYKKPEHLKFFVCIRDPIRRVISHHQHNYSRGTERQTLNNAIRNEIERLDRGERLENLTYIGPSFFGYFLRTWLSYFLENQFFVVSAEELRKSEVSYFDQIWNFLDIPGEPVDFEIIKNRGGDPVLKTLANWTFNKNGLGKGLLRRLINDVDRAQIRQFIFDLNRSRTKKRSLLDVDVCRRLDELFKSDYDFVMNFR